MRSLNRYQIAILLAGLVVVTWGALFLVYDYRSPVSHFLRGVGTVDLDGWSAYDLDLQCVRLEEPHITPVTTAQSAAVLAQKAHPTGYVREVRLVTFRDTCSKGGPRLAWAVAFAWPVDSFGPLPTGEPPRGIVLVDAVTGKLIANHVEGQPEPSPS